MENLPNLNLEYLGAIAADLVEEANLRARDAVSWGRQAWRDAAVALQPISPPRRKWSLWRNRPSCTTRTPGPTSRCTCPAARSIWSNRACWAPWRRGYPCRPVPGSSLAPRTPAGIKSGSIGKRGLHARSRPASGRAVTRHWH
eukprot:scaffold23402_cov125-Isochrysis_galbana.AAC.5